MGKVAKREPLLPAGREIQVALEQLEADLGGRSCIVAALALAPLTRDTRHLLGILADPANEKLSLVEICRVADTLPGKLIDIVDQGLRASGNIRSRFHISRQAAVVVADVMKRGAPHEDACPPCQGTGTLPPAEPSEADPNPKPKMCEACQGLGKLLFPADAEARKLALDLTGLMPKAGGISITNQQNLGLAISAGGELDQFQAALDQVLFGQGQAGPPAIDTTATEIEEPPA